MKLKDLIGNMYHKQDVVITKGEDVVFVGTAFQCLNKGDNLHDLTVAIFYGSSKKITIEVEENERK